MKAYIAGGSTAAILMGFLIILSAIQGINTVDWALAGGCFIAAGALLLGAVL